MRFLFVATSWQRNLMKQKNDRKTGQLQGEAAECGGKAA
jgi:hypothetical protein